MEMTRRGIMAAFVGLAASGYNKPSQGSASAIVGATRGLDPTPYGDGGCSGATSGRIDRPASWWREADKLRHALYEQQEGLVRGMDGGVAAKYAGMRSWSLQHKLRATTRETRAIQDTIRLLEDETVIDQVLAQLGIKV